MWNYLKSFMLYVQMKEQQCLMKLDNSLLNILMIDNNLVI